jgi:hypothetical protein
MKHRLIYDGFVELSMRMVSEGIIGIAFRVENENNYYAF